MTQGVAELTKLAVIEWKFATPGSQPAPRPSATPGRATTILWMLMSNVGAEYYACQTVQFPGCTLFAQKRESSVEGSDRGRLTR